jgi:AmmeMemoRadiSam system protein A
MLTDDQGKILIKLARGSISSRFTGDNVEIPNEEFLSEKLGVFVTLKEKGDLRGCIGFPEPVFELGKGLIKAAQAAAFEDPRFRPVEDGEKFNIEVSVLTKPVELDKGKLPEAIDVGTDGLIIRSAHSSGLLLPQVAVENRWDSKQFLEYACLKAQLPPGSWLDQGVKVFKFQCQIFQEQ